MASVVDIVNLALAHLGDGATVSSIDPPEGSAQAEHAARFFPIARDTLLEMHAWRFATRRVALTELVYDWGQWDHGYALPANCLRVLGVQAPEDPDDITAAGQVVSQPFTVELDDTGARVVLTDVPNAVARYVARVDDPTAWSPLFVQTLTWHLASMLAGPIIKGEAGAAEARRCAQMMVHFLAQARLTDANQRRVEPDHTPEWIRAR